MDYRVPFSMVFFDELNHITEEGVSNIDKLNGVCAIGDLGKSKFFVVHDYDLVNGGLL